MKYKKKEKKVMEKHLEKIKCPECGLIQIATVLHTLPWFSYYHDCINCKHTIMESEWECIARF
jgi:ribosomal protein S27E